MKLYDPMAELIENQFDVKSQIQSWFPDWTGQGNNVMCPKHEDTKPSLQVAPDGRAKCHGCSFYAKNFIDLYAKMEGQEYNEARQYLYRHVVKGIDEAVSISFENKLVRTKKAEDYLLSRGLTGQTIATYRLGFDPNTKRISIPIFDRYQTLVNFRLMALPGSKADNKAINYKGHGAVRLYPEWLIDESPWLVLVEGEWDCLIGRQIGLPTITWTGGAGSFGRDHVWMLKDKHVIVVYDKDKAGWKGQSEQMDMLEKLGVRTDLCDPLEFNIEVEGKDWNDWYLNSKAQLIEYASELVKEFSASSVESVKHVCPACGRRMP